MHPESILGDCPFQTPLLYPNSTCTWVASAQHVPIRTELRAGVEHVPTHTATLEWPETQLVSFCLKAKTAVTSRNVSGTLPTPKGQCFRPRCRGRAVCGPAPLWVGVGDAVCMWQRLGVLARAEAVLSEPGQPIC